MLEGNYRVLRITSANIGVTLNLNDGIFHGSGIRRGRAELRTICVSPNGFTAPLALARFSAVSHLDDQAGPAPRVGDAHPPPAGCEARQ